MIVGISRPYYDHYFPFIVSLSTTIVTIYHPSFTHMIARTQYLPMIKCDWLGKPFLDLWLGLFDMYNPIPILNTPLETMV